MDSKEKIINLLRSKLPAKYQNYNFIEETRFKMDLGMDSMNLAEFLLGLESIFSISLTSNYLRVMDLKTIGDAIKVVEEIQKGATINE